MPFKTFADDEVLTFEVVNRYFVQQTSIIKSADETVVNSTSTQNDDELFYSVLPDSQYFVEFFIIYDAIQAADIKIFFTGPAGSTFDWTHGGLALSTTSTSGSVSRLYRSLADVGTIGGPAVGAGTNAIIPGEGRLVTTGTGGNFRFQFAQNTLNATGTIVKANSVLLIQRLTV
jgi:hypothetical protein